MELVASIQSFVAVAREIALVPFAIALLAGALVAGLSLLLGRVK